MLAVAPSASHHSPVDLKMGPAKTRFPQVAKLAQSLWMGNAFQTGAFRGAVRTATIPSAFAKKMNSGYLRKKTDPQPYSASSVSEQHYSKPAQDSLDVMKTSPTSWLPAPKVAEPQGQRQAPRRRGRPTWKISQDDSPLRDGNRDRLMGQLTRSAARALLYNYTQTDRTLYKWFRKFTMEVPIPRRGRWEDVSGDTFLWKLMDAPIEVNLWKEGQGRNLSSLSEKDGREMAQRVMSIRSDLAAEYIEDLQKVKDENLNILRENMLSTVAKQFEPKSSDSADDMPLLKVRVVENSTSQVKDTAGHGEKIATTLRDANCHRLMGIVTGAAAGTLLYYSSETNRILFRWMRGYVGANPIPRRGPWEDVSGNNFIRKMMGTPTQFNVRKLGDPPALAVEPRQVAQRILDIRSQLAVEFAEDLQEVRDENQNLFLDNIRAMFGRQFENPPSSEGD